MYIFNKYVLLTLRHKVHEILNNYVNDDAMQDAMHCANRMIACRIIARTTSARGSIVCRSRDDAWCCHVMRVGVT